MRLPAYAPFFHIAALDRIMMDREKQSRLLTGRLSSALYERDGFAIGVDDKSVDLTGLRQGSQQRLRDCLVERIFAHSSRAVGAGDA